MSAACAACLRRGHLIGELAPRVAAVLAERGRPAPGLLALSDGDLIAALCGARRAGEAHLFLERFDPDAAAAAHERAGIATSCRHAGSYPPPLLALPDPPAALFLAGAAATLERLSADPAVTIVGTRRATPYGLDTARRLARGLAAAGVTVVSGLALGIDAAVHRGTLDGGGAGVAVLARGPERAYPAAHARLYRRLLERGAVLSELPPGVPVYRWSFPARNRIMAALTGMTVVVEAADPSGSLITARFALDLGRTVGAVPGRVSTRGAAGSNRLLRDGARVVLGPEDVLDELYGAGFRPAPTPDPGQPPLEPPLAAVLEAVESCDGAQQARERTGLRAGELRAALARLELLGLVARDGLGSYRRVAP